MNKILWLDIETTGLSPENDLILELSAAVTDDKLNVIETFSEVIHHADFILGPKLNEFAIKTHGASGLLTQVLESTKRMPDVEEAFLTFIEKHFDKKEKVILAGNSIHFDKSFIDRQMGELVKSRLHYRLIDVSGFNEFLKITVNFKVEKPVAKHRGLADVMNSIQLGKNILGLSTGVQSDNRGPATHVS